MDININSKLDPLPKFNCSCRSINFKDILPWSISQIITKTISICMRIVISCTMKRGIPFRVLREVNGNWDHNMIRISRWRESDYRRCTRVRKINPKNRTARVTFRDPSMKVNHFSKVVWDRKIAAEFTRSASSTRIPVLSMDLIKVSRGKYISRLVDWLIERTVSIFDEIASKMLHKDQDVDWYNKMKQDNKWSNQMKQLKESSEDSKDKFLARIISSLQKELPPSHKLQDHADELQNPFKLKEDNPSQINCYNRSQNLWD